jgi:hypothetical protein
VVQVPGAEWHTYDMEVQVVLEAAWSAGQQTVDISLHFPGCPYIMNFCNLTQVRKTSGFVRWVWKYSEPHIRGCFYILNSCAIAHLAFFY